MGTIALQMTCLFWGITLTFSNTGRVFRGETVTALPICIMAAAWTGFITLTWLV